MATIIGPKYTGDLICDLTSIKDDLVDIPPGGLKGARAEQEGMPDVELELAKAIPAHGEAGEIPTSTYERFVARYAKLKELRDVEMKIAKMLEVVTETRTKVENDVQDDLGAMAKCVQDAARRNKNDGIRAPFEKLLKYAGQIADKAASTRRKNAEAKANEPKPDVVTNSPAPGGQPLPA